MAPRHEVNVETIEFKGTLPLVINGGTTPVVAPQWTSKCSRPIAYLRSRGQRRIEIEATFSCSEPSFKRVKVRAKRVVSLPGSIGNVPPQQVTFEDGKSKPVRFEVPLRRDFVIDLDDVRWQWEFERSPRKWIESGNATQHDIAFVIAEPVDPWKRLPPGPHPWWEVLRQACYAARGVSDLTEAAEKVTRMVCEVWGGTIFKYGGGGSYATNGDESRATFDCARFIRLLSGEFVEPRTLDCSEVAAVVSTFSAILGCPLKQLFLDTYIRHDPIRLVGWPNWSAQDFGSHEIAVTGTKREYFVWDGSLEVSPGPRPVAGRPPAEGRLPANMQERVYLPRLLPTVPRGMAELARDREPANREIGPLPLSLDRYKETTAPLTLAAERFGLVEAAEASGLAVKKVTLSSLQFGEDGEGWELIRQNGDGDAATPTVDHDGVVRALFRSKRHPGQLLQAAVYLSHDAESAHRRMLSVLDRFKLFGLSANWPLDEPPQPGEDRRADADGAVVVGDHGNVVVSVTSASMGRADRTAAAELYERLMTALRAIGQTG